MAKGLSAVGRKLVLDNFKTQVLAIQIGATIQTLQRGSISIVFPRHPLVTTHQGCFHCGAITYLADMAAFLAGFSCL